MISTLQYGAVTSGADHVPIVPGGTAVTRSALPGAEMPSRAPTAIPRDQVYYWTARWQADEAAAVEELQRGEGRTFPDAKSAISWLLSEDE